MTVNYGFAGILLTVVSRLFDLAILLFFVRALLSWVDAPRYNPVVKFVTFVTEPVLRPLRRMIPLVRFGNVGIDFSIIAVFIGLMILRSLTLNLLVRIFY